MLWYIGRRLLQVIPVFLGATLKSIGFLGMILAFALCVALIWMIVSWGWVTLENTSALTWIVRSPGSPPGSPSGSPGRTWSCPGW